MTIMKRSHNYVLVFDQHLDDLKIIASLLEHLRCPVVMASSLEQVIATAIQAHPSLVILGGSSQNWSSALVNQLRNLTQTSATTIVALSDCHAPNWLPLEDNPGLDGYLVKPLSGDVLTSLVQSAWARQTCYCASCSLA
jgi:AmiR/NasT family two-component response regulator